METGYVSRQDGSVPTDTDHGSGAKSASEDWVTETAQQWESNDGRSQTQTTFYYTNTQNAVSADRHQLHRDPENRRSWSELAQWNDGLWAPDRAIQNYDADVERWIETFATQLGLNTTHVEQTEHIITNELDLEQWGNIPVEKVIIGTLSLVFDSLSNQTVECFNIEDWIVYWDEFEELMDSVDMDRSELWKVRNDVSSTSKTIDTQRS